MKFVELFEGATPKLPGAVAGIKVMSMDQFLAQSGDEPEEKIDEMSSEELDKMSPEELAQFTHKARTDKSKVDNKTIDQAYGKSMDIMFPDRKKAEHNKQQSVTEGLDYAEKLSGLVDIPVFTPAGVAKVVNTGDRIMAVMNVKGVNIPLYISTGSGGKASVPTGKWYPVFGVDPSSGWLNKGSEASINKFYGSRILALQAARLNNALGDLSSVEDKLPLMKKSGLGIINKDLQPMGYYEVSANPNAFKERINSFLAKLGEGPHYNIYKPKEQGMAEATKLPAQTRELKGQELDDYLDRIRNREKGKTDKYKLPYIHRSSVVKYYNEEGKKYDTDQIKTALGTRPKKLLKQNEKMKHSNGELEQFFNIGFAALVGIALDEGTNELIVVNTCPGAGSCKIECFAMKGGKVQFEGPWLSDGRILTFLLNDPDGFFNKLSAEITKEEKLAQKGGYNLTIRWHDAGDFFSPEYMDLAFKLAASHPDVKFYAYTKIADAALGQKPSNFIVNWSEGASTSQEKQIKAQDANLDTTKNSRIVPSKLFYDLLKKDKDNKLDKTADGAWQPRDAAALEELKDRLAKQYNLKRDSIIDYNEMMTTPQKNNIKKWNVIIAPGEGDISANRQDVLSTLLLKH